MVTRDDQAYFYDRAEAELTMAQKATSRPAVQAHYELANRYLDRVYGDPRSDADEAGSDNGSAGA